MPRDRLLLTELLVPTLVRTIEPVLAQIEASDGDRS